MRDLASDVGLSPATVYRLLQTLVVRGYVHTEAGRYRLVRQLGAASRLDRLCEAARPHLEAIRDELGETTNLIALHDGAAIYLAQAESRHAMRTFAVVGRSVPAYASAGGKALLSSAPPEQVAAQVHTFEASTRMTHTSTAALMADLARIRRRGYAVDREEYEEGVTCVAVLLPGGDAAISVSGPTLRMRRLRRPDVVALMHRHAAAAVDVAL